MRKQSRPNPPLVLEANAAKWNAQWVAKKRANPAASFDWYQFEGRSVREYLVPDLRNMNQGHCSFCDWFPLEVSSNEPIEHFRPKSREEFLEQAFEWRNLYYCCELCNTSKREQWRDELLAPDSDDYLFDKYFEFDFTTGEIKPNAYANPTDQIRALATIELFGLNKNSRPKYRQLALRNWSRTTDPVLDDFPFRDFIDLGNLTA
ncbi:MAG: TIGR02646 family protein [Planctomycetaceae bacterium]|nr:TIGR02646 family protein [Planctomycetaceae bacterium]